VRLACFASIVASLMISIAGASSGLAVPLDRAHAEIAAAQTEPKQRLVFEGVVLAPGGTPAEGAVVVSSAGGQAVADAAGGFHLEVEVPFDATNVRVTAVGKAGGNLVASVSVDLSGTPPATPTPVGPLRLARGATCSPSWLPMFGAVPGTDRFVQAMTVFDDGGGAALYIAGSFDRVGTTAANLVARWNGSSWSALGDGLNSEVWALAVYDDGSGPALYAGGLFTRAGNVAANRIARWDGSTWSALGSGVSGYGADDISPGVMALTVYDDGSGPALVAGGHFTTAGGVPAQKIAKWNGTTWAALGVGVTAFTPEGLDYGQVFALAVYDDGSGTALYAGGHITLASNAPTNYVATNYIAKWDGSTWSALGSGTDYDVRELVVCDTGAGPALCAGGDFSAAGGSPANAIAEWNGSTWAALGGGTGAYVGALAVYDDGSGPALYVGRSTPTGIEIVKWNGSSWTALGSGTNGVVDVLAVYDDGSGSALFAGGQFEQADGMGVHHVARWNGSTWSGLGHGLSSSVEALTVYDDGSGPALVVGGSFTSAGGSAVHRIAKWDGSTWMELGGGIDGTVRALAAFDDGSGPVLYAAGSFATAGGTAASNVARWNGSTWSALGNGTSSNVFALAVYDAGSGPMLYAGGDFGTAGTVTAFRIARWNGSAWSALGGGNLNREVYTLLVHDDGSGPALYVGGAFDLLGAAHQNHIIRWNGSAWSAVGTGTNQVVLALAEYDDGGGPALYAGGPFTSAGGGAAAHVARWNGSTWSALGSGTNSTVYALTAFDDGSGPALYAGGNFTTAGSAAANGIARWNGSAWSTLGGGMSQGAPIQPLVSSLVGYHGGRGPVLFAGGTFALANDSGDSFLAEWGCIDTTAPVLQCPPINVADGFLDAPGKVVHFTVTATDDLDPSPEVVCVPPSGSNFPRGTTIVHCTATDASGNQSECQFPVTVHYKAQRR